MTTEQAAPITQRTLHLLDGGSVMVGLGLTSGRAAAAMHKIQHDLPLDEIDRASVSKIGNLLRDSAESVKFFDSMGLDGEPPTESLAPQIETAIEVVLHNPTTSDASQLEASLLQFADSIEQVVESRHAGVACDLFEYLMRLSRSALQETASVGEITGRL